MKTMLITGASRGIGDAFVKEFQRDYNIVTVARTGDMTEIGDVTDKDFRDYLIDKYLPDVFVNNVGGYHNDMTESMEINLIQAGHLLEGFYAKMMKGHIINLGSMGGEVTGYANMGSSRYNYFAAKRALRDWIRYIQQNKAKRSVKITTLIPGYVDSNMHPNGTHAEVIMFKQQVNEIKRHTLAEISRWIIELPKDLVIEEIKIGNR